MQKLVKRILAFGALGGVAVFLLIQLVPYGRNHSNPPVTGEPNWDSPQTRELAQRACFDCHSNETNWPWYSSIAPFSWLVQRDTEEGRQHLNFSTWNRGGQGREPGEAVEAASEGSRMPPIMYVITHPNAKLTSEERQALAQGLRATIFQ